ncbi:hypothetical protein GC163_17315 [bacterium]|nr:hypothetical protein [bacterium]
MTQVDSVDVRPSEGWQTSATFQAEIYSGDFERYDRAYRRFVDLNLNHMLLAAQRHVPPALVQDVVQETLLKLHRQIWEKGWTHPPDTRFRQCVNQLAKDVVIDTLRQITRRQRVGDNSPIDDTTTALWEDTCAQWIDGFMRQEVLARAESAVQMEVSADHWSLYLAWKTKSGFVGVTDMTADTAQHLSDKSEPVAGHERVAVLRIRQKLKEEIQRLAEREGWQIEELW